MIQTLTFPFDNGEVSDGAKISVPERKETSCRPARNISTKICDHNFEAEKLQQKACHSRHLKKKVRKWL